MRPARKFKRPVSRFRKLAAGLVIALAGLCAAALIIPGYLDWNRFRSEIERQASAVTGREVHINGAIGFSLLPRPALSIENASIANPPGSAEPIMLSLERLQAQLGVIPLLSGKIQVASFRLIAPVLYLETHADGANNWTWPAPAPGTGKPGIRFEQVLIERGALRYRNLVSGADVRLSEMDLQLAAGSLHGPFEARGKLRLQNVPVDLDAAMGAITPERATPLNVKAALEGDARFDFTGTIAADGAASGALNSQGTDFNGLIASGVRLGAPALSGFQSPMLRRPYRMESSLAAQSGGVKLDKIKLSLGENMLSGSVSVETRDGATFAAILNASSLDLDALRTPSPAALSGAPVPAGGGFEIPHDITGSVRLSANAVKLNKGVMRDVTLAIMIADGAAVIDELGAQLPGSAITRISGKVTAVQGQPQFTGKLDLRSENLRGLLGWLGVAAPVMPERSLSRAQVMAQLDLSPELAQLHAISAEIDSSKLTGEFAVAIRERPALGVDLRIDQLNVDNYLPQENELLPDPPPADNTALAGGAPLAEALGVMDRFDSNFVLSVDALTFRGAPVKGLKADGAFAGGAITMNRFSVTDIAGTAFSMSGVLGDLKTSAQGEINLRLASNDLGGLARAAGVTLPVPGAQLGKSLIEAKFLLANGGFETVIDSRFGDTSLRISGGVSGLSPGLTAALNENSKLSAQISLANPSLRKFAAQAGIAISPVEAEDVAGVNLTAELAGSTREISLSAMNGAIGTVAVQGQARWSGGGPKTVLRGELSAGEILADHFSQPSPPSGAGAPPPSRQLPWSGAPLDLSFLDHYEAEIKLGAARFATHGYDVAGPSITLEIRDGQANLKQLTGNLFGGQASATGSLRGAGATVPELKLSWKLEGADMAAASAALSGSSAITGRLDLSGQVSGSGASSFAIISNLEGQAKFTATDGFIQGVNLPEFSARLGKLDRAADFLKLADTILQQGQTRYERIEVPFAVSQGIAQSSNPVVKIDAATGGLQASIDLPRFWLNAETSLTLNDHKAAPALGIAFIGPLNNPERTLRTEKLENYFTQALMSQSLERVISNRNAPAAPAPQAAPAPPPETAPPPPQENSARKVINGILDGILGDKPK